MKKDLFNLEEYHLTPELGCLMKNPLTRLPPHFDPWQKVIDHLPKLFEDKLVRKEVAKLPLLDHTKLKGNHQLYLAHLQLSYITSGYVWQDGDAGVVKTLPKSVAVPLHEVSKRLNLKPVITHCDVSLNNWTLIDPNGPMELDNIRCVCDMPGGDQGTYFCLVVAYVEKKFGICLEPMIAALNLLQKVKGNKPLDKEDEDALVHHLEGISDGVEEMKKALSLMHDGLEPYYFFNDVRPFFAGWGGTKSPLPDGLVFEGVSKEPVSLSGGSAAQSTSLQSLDSMFGVVHTEDQDAYLREMRFFMPPAHAKFIDDIEAMPTKLATYVRTLSSQGVRDAYNKCLTSMCDFRSYHMGVVSKFVVRPSKSANEHKYETLDDKGTGGSNVIPFLKKMRLDVKQKIVRTILSHTSAQSTTWLYCSTLTAFAVTAFVSFYVYK